MLVRMTGELEKVTHHIDGQDDKKQRKPTAAGGLKGTLKITKTRLKFNRVPTNKVNYFLAAAGFAAAGAAAAAGLAPAAGLAAAGVPDAASSCFS